MAELRDEDIKRLASDFLTTKADQNEIAALHMAVENNAAAALELLAQLQAAREGVRTGLSAEQNEGVRPRVEALIASHARKRGIFGLFKGRPKPVPAPEPVPGPASLSSLGTAPVPIQAPDPIPVPASIPVPAPILVAAPATAPVPIPVPVPIPAPAPAPAPFTMQAAAAQPLAQVQPSVAAADTEPDADMEDTAPIAEVVEAASITPRLGAPGSALAAMQASPVAAAAPAVQKPMIIPAAVNFGAVPESPQPYAPPKQSPKPRKGMAWALVLVLALALGYYYRGALHALYAPSAPAIVHPVRTPPQTAAVQGPPVRADAGVQALDAPLPAKLPPSAAAFNNGN